MKIPKKCKECGSASLTWQTQNRSFSGVQEGRLRSNEVQCQFVLGCDECSETLAVTSADKVAEYLNTRALPEGYVLAEVKTLKKIHRDLDACQKLIWGNMKGCDPAYYEDALVSLAHIDAMLAAAQEVE